MPQQIAFRMNLFPGKATEYQTRRDDHTMDGLADTEIMQRWWAHMADIMATDADLVPVQIPLKRVFQFA